MAQFLSFNSGNLNTKHQNHKRTNNENMCTMIKDIKLSNIGDLLDDWFLKKKKKQ